MGRKRLRDVPPCASSRALERLGGAMVTRWPSPWTRSAGQFDHARRGRLGLSTGRAGSHAMAEWAGFLWVFWCFRRRKSVRRVFRLLSGSARHSGQSSPWRCWMRSDIVRHQLRWRSTAIHFRTSQVLADHHNGSKKPELSADAAQQRLNQAIYREHGDDGQIRYFRLNDQQRGNKSCSDQRG